MSRLLVQLLQLERSAYLAGIFFRSDDLNEKLKSHLNQRLTAEDRGYLKSAKPRVFIAVKNVNWEKSGLMDSWRGVAEYLHYDWGDDYDQHAADWEERQKRLFNLELFRRVKEAHRIGRLTHFFSYLSGRWVYPETIEKIGALGIVTVNFSFDDSHRFWGKKRNRVWTGMASIAAAFDLNLTVQDRRDRIKYSLVGARALYMLPGGNEEQFYSSEDIEKEYFVSFVGQRYGVRAEIIEYLKKAGIDVSVWGKGWSSGMLSIDEMIEVFKRSYIVLGFGYVGNSARRTALKGRDFEVPLTGTAFCTSFNPELALGFENRREILLYNNREELLSMLRYYKDNLGEALEIGRRGRDRAIAGHTWSSRWRQLLGVINDAL